MKMQRSVDPLLFAQETANSVGRWLEQMHEGLEPSRFRFCEKRSLVPSSGQRAHFVTIWAMKTAWHMGTWDSWPDETRSDCTEFIKSFQSDEGYFLDSWVARHALLGTYVTMLRRGRVIAIPGARSDVLARLKRAETRQSAAALLMVDQNPAYALPVLSRSEADARSFITSLDWQRPWGAGSHASHAVFFVLTNQRQFGSAQNSVDMLEVLFDETDKLIDSETGTWGRGEIAPTERINGAMKMLTAYKWTERAVPHPEKLVDYALSKELEEDGCGVLDRLFVLYESGRAVPGYRTADIEAIALEALEHIAQFRKPDGGFSFNVGSAQTRYYGAFVSLGGAQSDMHGAVMLSWAAALSFDLLGIRGEVGWQISTP